MGLGRAGTRWLEAARPVAGTRGAWVLEVALLWALREGCLV